MSELYKIFSEGDSQSIKDPGASQTITVDRSPAYCGLTSTAAQTRTLGRPTRRGAIVTICHEVDGGDITLTVTGGYNEAGDTIITLSDAGQFVTLVSVATRSGVTVTYHWRLVSSSEIADRASQQFGTMAAPQTATDTATLTAAQMFGGVLVGTPTAAADYTTLTGAEIDDAALLLNPNLAVGDTFDLVIINLGGTGDDITYTAGASGISIVGNAVVGPTADVATEQEAQGTFRHRRTAADTWIAYRVA